MSEKHEDKKLGRNPLDHKKPSRAKRHDPGGVAETGAQPENPITPQKFESRPQGAIASSSSEIPFPTSPARRDGSAEKRKQNETEDDHHDHRFIRKIVPLPVCLHAIRIHDKHVNP
jgi:hypothetical protein